MIDQLKQEQSGSPQDSSSALVPENSAVISNIPASDSAGTGIANPELSEEAKAAEEKAALDNLFFGVEQVVQCMITRLEDYVQMSRAKQLLQDAVDEIVLRRAR